MPYSRDEVVREVTTFYEFLYPSPEGWPGITEERFAFLKKDDTVVGVLKHLPYIRRDHYLEPYQIYDNCVCNDYSGKHFERSAVKFQSRQAVEPDEIEAHIATLAEGAPADSGYFIYCDTKDGTIELQDWIAGKSRWRQVKEFFGMIKEESRSLSAIPIDPAKVSAVYHMSDDDLATQLREVYRKHGWPDGQYRKYECLKEARAIWDSSVFGT